MFPAYDENRDRRGCELIHAIGLARERLAHPHQAGPLRVHEPVAQPGEPAGRNTGPAGRPRRQRGEYGWPAFGCLRKTSELTQLDLFEFCSIEDLTRFTS